MLCFLLTARTPNSRHSTGRALTQAGIYLRLCDRFNKIPAYAGMTIILSYWAHNVCHSCAGRNLFKAW
jgi:hypothetical protein